MRGKVFVVILSSISMLFAGRPGGDVINRMYNDTPHVNSRTAKQGSTAKVSPSVKVKKTSSKSIKKRSVSRKSKLHKKHRPRVRIPIKALPKTQSGALGKPYAGRMIHFARLPQSGYYFIKCPERGTNYGTRLLVSTIKTACARYRRANRRGVYRPVIGDLSQKTGGPLTGHHSHQNGLDVDVGIPAKVRSLGSFRNLPNSMIDMQKTFLLIKSFIDTGRVQVIFIDTGIKAGIRDYLTKAGLIGRYGHYLNKLMYEPGHRDHMHIRLRNPG